MRTHPSTPRSRHHTHPEGQVQDQGGQPTLGGTQSRSKLYSRGVISAAASYQNVVYWWTFNIWKESLKIGQNDESVKVTES